MRPTTSTRLQKAQVFVLASVCALRIAAPSATRAQAATPVEPAPPTAAPGTAADAPAAPASEDAEALQQQAPPPNAAMQPSTTAAAPAQAEEATPEVNAAEPTPPGESPETAPSPSVPEQTSPTYPSPASTAEGQPQIPAAAEASEPPDYGQPGAMPVTAGAYATTIEAAPTPRDEDLVAPPKSKLPSYIMWGIGGASLITGAVLGISALTAKSDFDEMPTYAAADRTEGRAVAADVAFGLSAVLLVTGTIFYFMPDSQESRPTASHARRTRARLQVAPMFGRTNGGALRLQF